MGHDFYTFEITIQVFDRQQPFATEKGAKARMHYQIIMNLSWKKATICSLFSRREREVVQIRNTLFFKQRCAKSSLRAFRPYEHA